MSNSFLLIGNSLTKLSSIITRHNYTAKILKIAILTVSHVHCPVREADIPVKKVICSS